MSEIVMIPSTAASASAAAATTIASATAALSTSTAVTPTASANFGALTGALSKTPAASSPVHCYTISPQTPNLVSSGTRSLSGLNSPFIECCLAKSTAASSVLCVFKLLDFTTNQTQHRRY